MKEIVVGTSYSTELVVTKEQLASVAGSGTLDVFATPWMIAYMELAALHCAEPFMDEGETTVGTQVNVNHVAACGCGEKVYVTATITEVDRKRIVFDVNAKTDKWEIGSGKHERFVIDIAKFCAKSGI
ncbi:MAG: thioesterase family protein [Clostridia bacterium]|nr:thioesterase family protein [Clostridia bacterium]